MAIERCKPRPQPALWLRFWGRREGKERRKLRSHGTMLHARAERFVNVTPDADPPVCCRVTKLLMDKCWCEGDLAAAFDHADELEELLPYIADETYLRATLTCELNRTDEPIRLTTLLPETELDRLRDLSDPRPPSDGSGAPDVGSSGDGKRRTAGGLSLPARKRSRADGSRARDVGSSRDGKRRMAESLSLLARERSGQRRHERLMTELREPYMVFFAVLIAFLLAVIFIAVVLGVHAKQPKPDVWAHLLLVLSSGALGSVLAAASRLKEQLDLNSFRAVVRLIYIQPLVGAAFGLISWLLLTAGVVTVAGTTITTAWATQAAVAFASGFSEPFAIGILRRLTPGNAPASDNRPPP